MGGVGWVGGREMGAQGEGLSVVGVRVREGEGGQWSVCAVEGGRAPYRGRQLCNRGMTQALHCHHHHPYQHLSDSPHPTATLPQCCRGMRRVRRLLGGVEVVAA